MITSEHTTASIGDWLNNFKYFATKTNKWPIAKIIVTGFSWATIHSILLQWNSMNIQSYLKLTYDVLIHKQILPADFMCVKLLFSLFTQHNRDYR